MHRTASVAMAAYNGELFIAEQIDSILERLEEQDELVISYDESSDSTLEIIRRYCSEDHRVKLVQNLNPGIVGNFNNALAACRNDIIFISDQDDLWVGDKRNVMVEALASSGADLAIHNVVHIDEGGKIISQPLFEEYGIGLGKLRNFAMPRYSGCCMAFPRDTMRIIHPMPLSVINYDHWIGMACEIFGHIQFVNEVLLHHRLHGANATTQRRPLALIAQQRSHLLRELAKRHKELVR